MSWFVSRSPIEPGGPNVITLTLRLERLIARIPPEINCALFLIGFYLGVSLLLTHLSWYGVPQAPQGWVFESHRMLMKMGIFLILVAAIALVAPGSLHRRLFSACAFPLLALLAMLVHDASLPVINWAPGSEHALMGVLLRATALGVLMGLVVSYPVALLFRGSCAPVVLLVILPALAKEVSAVGRAVQMDVTGWPLATLFCEAMIVAACTYGCFRYLSTSSEWRSPEI